MNCLTSTLYASYSSLLMSELSSNTTVRQYCPRNFSSTSRVCVVNKKHPLVWHVDWLKVAAGFYCLVDPNTPAELLYLNRKAYERLVFVMLSNEADITIIAAPGDVKPRESEITAPKPETSPPSLKEASAAFWRGMRSVLSRKYRAFMVDGRSMFKVTDPLVSKPGSIHHKGASNAAHANELRFRSLVTQWGVILLHWLGSPGSAKTVITELRNSFSILAKIGSTRGSLALAGYLKVSSLFILAYLSGERKDPWSFGTPVELAHGLPKWLPVGARNGIRSKSGAVIKFWLSICATYKIIFVSYDVAKAIKGVTIPQIEITPLVQTYIDEYRHFLLEHYIPSIGGVREIPKEGFIGPGGFYKDTSKTRKGAIPTRYGPCIIQDQFGRKTKFFTPCTAGPNGTAILSMGKDAQAWVRYWRITRDAYTSRMSPLLTSLCQLSVTFGLPTAIDTDELQALALKSKGTGEAAKPGKDWILSRLHLLPEPAGKLRVIAIGDIFTQRVLKPLHDHLFRILQQIPQDGTHSQDRLFNRLRLWKDNDRFLRKLTWSSLDISAATDSIPRFLYKIFLECLWGGGALAAKTADQVLTLMTDRDFSLSAPKNLDISEFKGKTFRYGRGQPMGFLGSFALLALWNHSWVQFASFKAGGSLWAWRPHNIYGVTGDDVVIGEPDATRPIANMYLHLCKVFSIGISLPKSYFSSELFNFLSRTVYRDMEISPISIKEEFSVNDPGSRAVRAVRAISRDVNVVNDNGWLLKAVKYFLYPSEYLSFVANMREGKLEGYGMRAILQLLTPSPSSMKVLGLSRVPVLSWLATCVGSTSLLGQQIAVQSDAVSIKGINLRHRYSILRECLSVLLEEYELTLQKTMKSALQYENWYQCQLPILKHGLSQLFLPSPTFFNYERDMEWRYLQRDGVIAETYPDLLGEDWDADENLYDSIQTVLQLINDLPPIRDYSNADIFKTSARELRRGGGQELSSNENRLFSLMFKLAMNQDLVGIEFELPSAIGEMVEKRIFHKFGF